LVPGRPRPISLLLGKLLQLLDDVILLLPISEQAVVRACIARPTLKPDLALPWIDKAIGYVVGIRLEEQDRLASCLEASVTIREQLVAPIPHEPMPVICLDKDPVPVETLTGLDP